MGYGDFFPLQKICVLFEISYGKLMMLPRLWIKAVFQSGKLSSGPDRTVWFLLCLRQLILVENTRDKRNFSALYRSDDNFPDWKPVFRRIKLEDGIVKDDVKMANKWRGSPICGRAKEAPRISGVRT